MPNGRGKGQGRGGGQGKGGGRGQGKGQGKSPTHCVCPNCGTKVPHQRGVPCRQISCPKCGTQMMGE